MKKRSWKLITTVIVLGLFVLAANAHALNPETEMLLQLLEKKGVVTKQEADTLRQEVEGAAPTVHEEPMKAREEHVGGVKGLEKRLEEVEGIVEGIQLGGLVEIEAGYEHLDFEGAGDEDSSDISVATVELSVDAGITDQLRAHVLLLYEEEEDDQDIVIDEAILHIRAEDVCVPDKSCESPWYVSIGKLYVPFGYFESHFVSDPLTLELGETRESALVAGLANDWVNVALGAFNGDISERGDDDNHIENFVASAFLTLPEESVPGLSLKVGVSYINDIADTDSVQDALQDEDGFDTDEVKDDIGGFSAFVSASLMDKLFLEAEYVGAMDAFESSDLGLDPGEKFEPEAWNIELAWAVIEDLELAVKYEGSNDALDLIPAKRYGGAITYGLFENTSLGLEYLYGEFENDDEVTTVTGQVAVEF